MHQSLWPYLMTLANFLHSSFIPSQKQLTHRHSALVNSGWVWPALSAMGVFFLFLLEILCKPFSLPFVLRREALSLTNTSSSAPPSLLVYHSTFFLLLFFQDLLQTRGSVFLASGLLNCGRKYKKSFPAIGQYGHVLSLKGISVLLPRGKSLDRMANPGLLIALRTS